MRKNVHVVNFRAQIRRFSISRGTIEIDTH